jgi:hypothetical protein
LKVLLDLIWSVLLARFNVDPGLKNTGLDFLINNEWWPLVSSGCLIIFDLYVGC